MTDNRFVKVLFDVKRTDRSLVDGGYRVYVDDELFTQRTWSGSNFFLREMVQILAPPGKYNITIEQNPGTVAQFKPSNFKVIYGPGKVSTDGVLTVSTSRR